MMKTVDILNSNINNNIKYTKIFQKTRYYTKTRADRKMDVKIDICNCFMNELQLQSHLRQEIIYMITNEFKDLKTLHRQLNNEQIIALIIFYVMRKHKLVKYVENYKFFKKLEINEKHYTTFLTNLASYYQRKKTIPH